MPNTQPPAAGSPLAVGAALQALPIDHMIAVPLLAAVSAQIRASRQYVDFIEKVGMDKGKAIMVPFEYEEDKIGTDGQVVEHVSRKMVVPLLALVQHPAMVVEEADVHFEMEVNTMESEHSMTSGEGGFDASVGYGPFSVHVHGKISHKSEQTRSTDTRSKYVFNVKMSHKGQTEGMSRVLDAMVDSAVRPVSLGAPVSGPAAHVTGNTTASTPGTAPGTP